MRLAIATLALTASLVGACDQTSAVGMRVWPLPASCSSGSGSVTLPSTCSGLAVVTSAPSGPGLAAVTGAISRFQTAVFGGSCSGSSGQSTLRVSVDSTAHWPPAEPGAVDESYSLSVDSSGAITLSANATAGALHGMRALQQLCQRGGSSVTIAGTPLSIADAPFYAHRGVMLDLARHFLTPATIIRTVKAAAASGMNAVHLHISDAESFPVEIPTLPLLSGKGAYAPSAVLSPADLASIVQVSTSLGVVIIPEIDVPGHAYSWGMGYPNVTAVCPPYAHNINNIPLNPAVEFAYDALQTVLQTLAQAFPSNLFHIGVSSNVNNGRR
jgi:hexosaminidase